jgi:hypothetical protein
MKRD